MKETPVNKIMESTLDKMRDMVDVSTIIGEPVVTGNTTLIPVSKRRAFRRCRRRRHFNYSGCIHSY